MGIFGVQMTVPFAPGVGRPGREVLTPIGDIMKLTGELYVAGSRVSTETKFQTYDVKSGVAIDELFFSTATSNHIEKACRAAHQATQPYSSLPLEQRASFLERIADNIEAIGPELFEFAHRETALPQARLEGERARTIGQLKMFAAEVRDGSWQGIRIDHADPIRSPRKPDLRQRKIPVGPVAIFGASNFPLAFSTAGGDTAAAFAAGCPVIVKGHPSHPGTSELIAWAINSAVNSCGLPVGVFSHLAGASIEIGQALVKNPDIAAVGFTGSRDAGLNLMKIAAQRSRPIPVFAEMSAINPVIILPGAMASGPSELARAYIDSVVLGAGQFCTNPSMLLAIRGPDLDEFMVTASQYLAVQPAQTMLSPSIRRNFVRGKTQLFSSDRVSQIGVGAPGLTGEEERAALFALDGKDLHTDPVHLEEIFGASSLIVSCASEEELLDCIVKLEGQLTATLHLGESDYAIASQLLPNLERIAGRIIANGWPTGVEVTHAMVHGGPYPATSDGRSTSVGTLAIERFLRPICFQDMPADLLPQCLREGSDFGGVSRVNGEWKVQ